jgi:protocatechuate 3,4-dioxygenase alpha subunit
VAAGRRGPAIPDGLIETWQADPDGRFDHPDDRGRRGGPAGFRGFGALTGPDGSYHIITLRPGALPSLDGGQSPAPGVTVFARGLLDRVVTRLYFPDEAEANAGDPVLSAIADPARRDTLIATSDSGDNSRFQFDIRLQGEHETVFFDV